MIELSIVSGTYNRLAMLQRMVYSVRSSVGDISYEVIIVDAGSTDGSIAWCKTQRDIRLIEHGELLGAIKAYDDGAAAAQGEYVGFANDDLTFVDDALRKALAFMYNAPSVGIGLFQTNRSNRGWHIAQMPAHNADGSMTNAPYGGIMITRRTFGDKLHWWELPGARTYGGDCAMCARSLEAGWPVVEMQGIRVNEPQVEDALKKINCVPINNDHPDTAIYLRMFPQGPELGRHRQSFETKGALRILYAPIYEEGHKIQHIQKRGLRRALQRIGVVREVDYITQPDAILALAEEFRPDLVLTQLHYGKPFTAQHAARLREIVPNARLVNWNGDVYDRSGDADYIELLQYFDLQTTVNESAVANYQAKGIRAAFWQIGVEPDGIGHKPDEDTPAHEAILLANGYRQERHDLGAFLRSLPHDIAIYGDYWPQGWAHKNTLYDFAYGCQLYRNAKIALGDSDWSKEGGRGFVSNRMFQAMAAGGCLMLQQQFDGCAELLHLIDGKHLILWRDYDDLRDKLAYWLDPANESARAEIAKAGQLEVLKHHSFEARVRELMQMLPRIDNMVPGVRPELIGSEYA